MNPSTHTLTVTEAAEELGVSERTIWRYLKSGRLNGETVGEPGAQRTQIAYGDIATLKSNRAGDADEIRAERDRLASELAAARAERDALSARLAALQRAVAGTARPSIIERLLAWSMGLAARRRASVVR